MIVFPASLRVVAVVYVLACASVTRADEPAHEPERSLHIEPGFLPTAAAAVPGFLIPGAGAFLAGDRVGAKRLAITRASAFGLFFGSGALIATTGTSRRLIGTLAPVAIMGIGTFLVGWLADIYAASTGGREARVSSWTPRLEAEVGPRYVYDPQFDYGAFLYGRVDARFGRFRMSPSAWVAMNDNNQRLALDAAVRVLGPTPRKVVRDGSYVDVATQLTFANYGSDQFRVWTPEFRLDGRLDLVHLGPSFAGAFAEGQLGAGLEVYAFDGPGTPSREDAFGLLLARFGFGVYFGEPVTRSGEVLLYYDHRRDEFAGGMGVRGIAGGVLGHVGVSARYFLTPALGVSFMSEIGSAFVSGLSLCYRMVDRTWGGTP